MKKHQKRLAPTAVSMDIGHTVQQLSLTGELRLGNQRWMSLPHAAIY